MAGESPDRSKQRESSAQPTSGSAGPVPEARSEAADAREERDPRLAVARDAAASSASSSKKLRGGVDTATRVLSARAAADDSGTGEGDDAEPEADEAPEPTDTPESGSTGSSEARDASEPSGSGDRGDAAGGGDGRLREAVAAWVASADTDEEPATADDRDGPDKSSDGTAKGSGGTAEPETTDTTAEADTDAGDGQEGESQPEADTRNDENADETDTDARDNRTERPSEAASAERDAPEAEDADETDTDARDNRTERPSEAASAERDAPEAEDADETDADARGQEDESQPEAGTRNDENADETDTDARDNRTEHPSQAAAAENADETLKADTDTRDRQEDESQPEAGTRNDENADETDTDARDNRTEHPSQAAAAENADETLKADTDTRDRQEDESQPEAGTRNDENADETDTDARDNRTEHPSEAATAEGGADAGSGEEAVRAARAGTVAEGAGAGTAEADESVADRSVTADDGGAGAPEAGPKADSGSDAADAQTGKASAASQTDAADREASDAAPSAGKDAVEPEEPRASKDSDADGDPKAVHWAAEDKTGTASETDDTDTPGEPPVDQPTAVFKAVRPPVDQPTTMLKLGGAARGAGEKSGGESEAERTSRFVALKPLDDPTTRKPPAGSSPRVTPADATAPVPTVGPERTTQQPLPPKPPLDLLAELTNTPPPPDTALRTTVRRVKIWTPLVLLLVIVFAVVQSVRPLPTPTLELTAESGYTFKGAKVDIPWPSKGQAALDVQGIGSFGSSGEQRPVPIASVAKVMTAYLILREHPLKSGETGPKIEIDQAAQDQSNAGQESTVNVTKGDKITEREALESILIASANNVARLLARWDAGSEKAFVAKMNDAAKELGMKNTTYTDPSGLNNTTVSTAVDQVKLAKAAMQQPAFREVAAMMSYDDYKGVNHSNWNHLVGHNNVVGIKTGTTTSALGNLVFAAKKEVGGETRTIVGAVVRQPAGGADNTILGAALDSSDKLIRAAQGALESATILKKGDVVGYADDGLGGRTPVVATEDVKAIGWPGLSVKLTFAPDDLPHQAKAGTKVGTLTVGDGSSSAVKVPVALQADLVEPGFTDKLTRLG